MDYSNVPGCTYCQPQVASVGMTEKAAREAGHDVKIGRFPFKASGKARAIGETDGFVKLVIDAKYGEILGGHIVGAEATEMIAEICTARAADATAETVMHAIHAHPTLSEGVMEAALDAYGQALNV
jgi:dihydrolipoamide dehydrogenase